MANGAYGYVPAALRETGRTISDIAGIEARSRIAGGEQRLRGAKLRYGISKDIREQQMNTPMGVDDAMDFFGIPDDKRKKIVGSETYKIIKESGGMATPRSLAAHFETVRQEQRATTETARVEKREDKLAGEERARKRAGRAYDLGAKLLIAKARRATAGTKLSFADKEYIKNDIDRIQKIEEELRVGTMPDPKGGFMDVAITPEYRNQLLSEAAQRKAAVDARLGKKATEKASSDDTGANAQQQAIFNDAMRRGLTEEQAYNLSTTSHPLKQAH